MLLSLDLWCEQVIVQLKQSVIKIHEINIKQDK